MFRQIGLFSLFGGRDRMNPNPLLRLLYHARFSLWLLLLYNRTAALLSIGFVWLHWQHIRSGTVCEDSCAVSTVQLYRTQLSTALLPYLWVFIRADALSLLRWHWEIRIGGCGVLVWPFWLNKTFMVYEWPSSTSLHFTLNFSGILHLTWSW